MKTRAVAVLLAALVAVPGTVGAIDRVIMPAANGDVTFDHKRHSESMACRICHGEGAPGRVEMNREKAHALCRHCHHRKLTGPVRCRDCHGR